MRIIFIVRSAILLTSLAVVMPACGGDSVAEKSMPVEETPAATAVPDAADGPAPVDLPHSEALAGRRLTVLEFGNADPSTQEFEEIAEGHELVYVRVRVENVDADPWESSLVQFFLLDETGDTIGPALMFQPEGDGERFPRSDLARGESSEGYVGYQVPAGGGSLRLSFAVNLFANQSIIVPLR